MRRVTILSVNEQEKTRSLFSPVCYHYSLSSQKLLFSLLIWTNLDLDKHKCYMICMVLVSLPRGVLSLSLVSELKTSNAQDIEWLLVSDQMIKVFKKLLINRDLFADNYLDLQWIKNQTNWKIENIQQLTVVWLKILCWCFTVGQKKLEDFFKMATKKTQEPWIVAINIYLWMHNTLSSYVLK